MGDRGNYLLRFLDRFIGIPLVFLAGLFVPRRPLPIKIDRIGILATAAIGDTLLLSAVIGDMRAAYPHARFTLFCGKTIVGISDMAIPDMERIVIPVENPLSSLRKIRSRSFDVFLDCGPWPRLNSLLTHFSKSRCKIGFRSKKQYRHFVYNIPVDHRDDCHELENHRRLARALGVTSSSMPFLGKAEPDRKTPYILIHMFPSGYRAAYKEWDCENWIDLIDGLTGRGCYVILTGGPADGIRAERIVELCRSRENIRNLAGKLSLRETGELLRKALVVVSVNTGIMHMAAAYDQWVVALHGPTSVLRWGPLCRNAFNFTATTPGAGCLHLGFEYRKDDPHSLDSIVPETVIERVYSLWKERIGL